MRVRKKGMSESLEMKTKNKLQLISDDFRDMKAWYLPIDTQHCIQP